VLLPVPPNATHCENRLTAANGDKRAWTPSANNRNADSFPMQRWSDASNADREV